MTLPELPISIGDHIVVIGTSGAGKSTLAKQIAKRGHYKHIELDALSWEANWTQVAPEILRERTQQAIAEGCWVLDGNYGYVRDLVWKQADTVIWLDYPRWLVMWRVIKRTARRTLTRQVLWNGNREPFSRIFTRDSIILWAWQTHARRRKEFSLLIRKPEYAHIRFFRFSSPRATDQWLRQMTPEHQMEA